VLEKKLIDQPALSVFVIATNRYTEFFPELLKSIETYCMPNEIVEVIFLTDVPNLPIEINLANRIQLKIVEIPPYVWPEATLLRYYLMSKFWNLANGHLVMYLDVDTKFINRVTETDFRIALDEKPIALVAHPGYFKRNPVIQMLNRLSFKIGWETRRKSLAFVPLSKRKIYVCGGVWMGKNNELRLMVNALSETVNLDRDSNIMAKFHDESHLNMWLSKNDVLVSILSPVWAHASNYKHLRNLKPFIEVLEKPIEFVTFKLH
jgi:hypothetical protein